MFCRILVLVAAGFAAADFGGNNGRICGGELTTIEEHPYQRSYHGSGGVATGYRGEITGSNGANKTTITLRAGSTNQTAGGFTYNVDGWILSPEFNRTTMDYNIAVIKLATPIQFGPAVKPVELITRKERPRHGDVLIATGWGRTTYSAITRPHILHKIRLPTLNAEYCRLGAAVEWFKYTDNMLCAGGGLYKVTNTGDGGGPVVNEDKKLVGVVSWDLVLGTVGFPAYITDITSPPIRNFVDGVLNGTIQNYYV